MRRFLWSLLVAVTLVGCPMPGSGPDRAALPGEVRAAEALSGVVEWDVRRVQATMSEVASASTVSLINTQTGETAATTVTDGQGRFKLAFPATFAPGSATYYLEAIKGLNANLPGKNVARVRTVARYADGWLSLSNASPGSLVLNTTTTAVAIAGALRGVSDFSAYMGAVSGTSYTPPGGSPVTTGDCTAVAALIIQALAADGDPVAGVALSSGNWVRVNSGQALSLTQLAPVAGSVGTTLQATGSALSLAAENVVGFGGATASAVASPNGTTLSVVVPSGARSGQTTVQVGGVTALGPLFTVTPKVHAVSPRAGVGADAAGRTGSLVTVHGEGFGGTGVVTLNGTPMTVVSWSNSAIVAALPFGASTGPVVVTVGGNSGTGPSLTVVANAAPNASLDALAGGSDPTTYNSDGGASTQLITSYAGARSGSNVLRWNYSSGSHRRLFPGIKPTKTVIVAGCWVRMNGNLNTWSNGKGTVSGRGVIPVTAHVWGTPWLTTVPSGGTYAYTTVPDTQSMTTYPVAEAWQYLQATASAIVGSNYDYGLAVQGGPWNDNGFMWDVDDLVLFQCDP